jgi:hypothetical protein
VVGITSSVYSQSTSAVESIKVGNKTYLKSIDGYWTLTNKAMADSLELMKGENGNIDEERMNKAYSNVKVQNSNDEVLNIVRSVFSSSEIAALKDERILLMLMFNNKGKVFYISFSLLNLGRNPVLEKMDLKKYSQLEDLLVSKLKFTISDTSFDFYRLSFPLTFKNVQVDGYVFPKKVYANP